jgi:hypothetical protein
MKHRPAPPEGCQTPEVATAAANGSVNTIHELTRWLDEQLELLTREYAEWQTIDTNRKYFGR